MKKRENPWPGILLVAGLIVWAAICGRAHFSVDGPGHSPMNLAGPSR